MELNLRAIFLRITIFQFLFKMHLNKNFENISILNYFTVQHLSFLNLMLKHIYFFVCLRF